MTIEREALATAGGPTLGATAVLQVVARPFTFLNSAASRQMDF